MFFIRSISLGKKFLKTAVLAWSFITSTTGYDPIFVVKLKARNFLKQKCYSNWKKNCLKTSWKEIMLYIDFKFDF